MAESNPYRRAIFLSGGFAYLLYLVLALVLLAMYRLQLNPDAVSYFTIAEEYWKRAIPDAINGAFSPLYSWLLAPLLAMGIGGPLAARMLAIPIGAAVVWLSDQLGKKLDLAADMGGAIRLALVILAAALGAIVMTPDLLATAITLAYLLVLCCDGYLRRPVLWLCAGVLGTLMFLAKAYVMWFFVGHFILIHLIWLAREKNMRMRIAVAVIAGLVVFAITSAPWVAALSWKYHHFALNTTGQYNHAIEAPGATDFPPGELGLLKPPTRMAVSIWEDVSTVHLPDWNEFANGKNLRHFLLMIARNLGDCLESLCCYSVLLPAVAVIAAVVAGYLGAAGAPGVLTLAAIVYPLGYLLRHVEQRFLSTPAILLILLAGWLIENATRTYAIPFRHRRIAIWVLAISVLPNPIWNVIRYSGSEGKRLKNVGEFVARYVPAHANIASDDDWFTSMYASYYAHLRYFGIPRPGESQEDFSRDLKSDGVEYLLLWENANPPYTDWKELSSGGNGNPAIYKYQPD